MKRIIINASTEYSILIGRGLVRSVGELIKDELFKPVNEKTLKADSLPRLAIISDDIVFGLFGKQLTDTLRESGFQVDKYVFNHGEASKNLETYGNILNFLCNNNYTRSDIIIALGGGVVGDIAGFAAATYQRGIRYIQIPTTLLAMVDSSVGGKTAIDLDKGKNQAGCFYQPSLVICDPDMLNTLPDEQYRCGCAEIIKYAVLEGPEFMEQIKNKPVRDHYENVIEACVLIKNKYVTEDEFDRGLRMKLNLGHSIGHCVEALSGFDILHGQGVSVGMACIARAAYINGYCSEKCRDEIIETLTEYGLPVELKYNSADIIETMKNDKKISDGKMHLIVPVEIGECKIIEIAVDELNKWA